MTKRWQFWAVAALVAGALSFGMWQKTHPDAPKPVATYLNALVRGDWKTAYARTRYANLQAAKQPGPTTTKALTFEHFAAFHKAHRLVRYRVLSGPEPAVVSLVYADGSRTKRYFSRREPIGEPPIRVGITTSGGPLPGLAVDGIPVPVAETEWRAGFVGVRGYLVDLIPGAHDIQVKEGPATAAQTIPFNPKVAFISFGPAQADLKIGLSVSDKGIKAARSAFERWRKSCVGKCRVVYSCGAGIGAALDFFGLGLSQLDPPTLTVRTTSLVTDAGVRRQDGWGILVAAKGRGRNASPFGNFVTEFAGGKVPATDLDVEVVVDFKRTGSPSVRGACVRGA